MRPLREPSVAGLFYPNDPAILRRTVSDLLAQAETPQSEAPPKALILPHAGYRYSGEVAAAGYARLRAVAGDIRRVVLLGPAHFVSIEGLAAPSVAAFRTPLGEVELDAEAVERIADLPQVRLTDSPHRREHSLEVQLPFLQVLLAEFKLVPLAVGCAGPDQVDEVLERLWGGPETLILVSSDLSHYHDETSARRLDADTTRAIETLNEDAIEYHHACGRDPIRGLLRCARALGLKATTLDRRTSADAGAGRDRVVGYGAWAFR